MPKTKLMRRKDLPGPLKRSSKKAQDTFRETLRAAIDQYGKDGQRARSTAWASVKHSYEKVGDRWKRKKDRGPSDSRAERGGPPSSGGTSHGGVDANATKAHLYEIASKLEIVGRSRMTKPQLVEAIDKANAKATRKATRKSS